MKPIEPTVVGSRSSSSSAKATTPTIISADTELFGNIVSSGEIQIEGSVEGDVRATALVVGTNATISGEVVAENVHIRGSITGTVRTRTAVLVGGCRVVGDIINQSLEIEKGSHFEGMSRHAGDPMADAEGRSAKADKAKKAQQDAGA